jgi:hypothetical protein
VARDLDLLHGDTSSRRKGGVVLAWGAAARRAISQPVF